MISKGMRKKHQGGKGRRPWKPMKLNFKGRVSDIVKGGGGKLSLPGGDPGEGRKQSGSA